MRLIRGMSNLKKNKPCVAVLGNFDGMHLGHQALLSKVRDISKKHQLLSCVIIFEPHPKEFFYPETPPGRIMNLREKLLFLRQYGIDQVVCLPFNTSIASCSPCDVIQVLLKKKLCVEKLVVGLDFRFGANRKGNIALLRDYFQSNHLFVMPSFLFLGKRVSSTWLRELLHRGDFKQVKKLLGRPFTLTGRVQKGNGYARTWGFPTANVDPRRKKIPLQGVYVIEATFFLQDKQQCYFGVANLGCRPTLQGKKYWLEVHLFNFDHHLYGIQLQVKFIKKIRNEKRFEDFDALKAQIYKDKEVAIAYINSKHDDFLSI